MYEVQIVYYNTADLHHTVRPVFHVRDIVREKFALVQLCVYVSMCAISRAGDFSYAIQSLERISRMQFYPRARCAYNAHARDLGLACQNEGWPAGSRKFYLCFFAEDKRFV